MLFPATEPHVEAHELGLSQQDGHRRIERVYPARSGAVNVARLDAAGFPTWVRLSGCETPGSVERVTDMLRHRWPEARAVFLRAGPSTFGGVHTGEFLVVREDYVPPPGGGYPSFVQAKGGAQSMLLDTVLLREVARSIYVGSDHSHLSTPAGDWTLVIQLAESCPQIQSVTFGAGPGRTVLRIPFPDENAPSVEMLRQAVGAVYDELGHSRAEVLTRRALPRRPVLIQCQAGLSRSAGFAYATLRLLWGLGHDEALRRVQVRRMTSEWPRRHILDACRGWVEGRSV